MLPRDDRTIARIPDADTTGSPVVTQVLISSMLLEVLTPPAALQAGDARVDVAPAGRCRTAAQDAAAEKAPDASS